MPFTDVPETLASPSRKILNMLAPQFKFLIERVTGQNIFKNKKISEDNYGGNYSNAPQVIKDFLDYRVYESKSSKTGKTFKKITVDPERKYILETFPFTSRFLSTFRQMYQGDTAWEKVRPLITSLKEYQFDQDYFDAQNKKELDARIEEILEREGMGYFYKRFIPKQSERIE